MSLVNSTKQLINTKISHAPLKTERGGKTSQLILWDQYYSDTKTSKSYHKTTIG